MLSPTDIQRILSSDPDAFEKALHTQDDITSLDFAAHLDDHDPLRSLRDQFNIGEIIPFAGHSLGPTFKQSLKAIKNIHRLQRDELHAGHFPETADRGGNWFDCDIDPESVDAMQPLLGFKDPAEFIYTQSGLSANLANLLGTFYNPSRREWETGKSHICYLGAEFFSDQSVIHSVLERAIQTAYRFEIFADQPRPTAESQTIKLLPNDDGLYDERSVIETVGRYANEIKILHLSDVVFNTGQRLDIPLIISELKDTIRKHNIIVGLDLAHTVANRPVDLAALEVVTYAVGCGYKHACGTAGSGFGIYVNKDSDLNKYQPVQGWKAADSSQVFQLINSYDPDIMSHVGARAFRASNASPVAIAPIQTYVKEMKKIGWDKLMARSECLTRYMLALLKQRLGDRIQIVTPEDPHHRGATIVFRVKDVQKVSVIEEALKLPSVLGQFEVDTRPPNNVRVTAHYGYISFTDIQRMVTRLERVLTKVLVAQTSTTGMLSVMSLFAEQATHAEPDDVSATALRR